VTFEEHELANDIMDQGITNDLDEALAIVRVRLKKAKAVWINAKDLNVKAHLESGTIGRSEFGAVLFPRRPCFYFADGGYQKPLKEPPCECGSWETCDIYERNPRESWASCRWGGQEYGRRAFYED